MNLYNCNYETLAENLEKTLSPELSIRQTGEKFLHDIELEEGFPLRLLNLVDKEDYNVNIRVAGALAFKNYVKRNWGAHENNSGVPNKIVESDRFAVKKLIITLKLKSPAIIQKQLGECVGIIGMYDFPTKWPELIDEIVDKFTSDNFQYINGVLHTAHSLFKRYRHEFKSQKLWEEILFVLNKISQPLTDLLIRAIEASELVNNSNNEEAITTIYNSLVLICKIFYSLNSQDIPEFFEDNMKIWMPAFHKLLTVKVPILQAKYQEESGVLEHLRSQISDNLGLYAQKYDEEFKPYTPQFVTVIWELLVTTGTEPKYDELVANSMKFLNVVADRHYNRDLFLQANVLSSICEKVVVPNMDFRVSDQELFEFNPEEYIRRDMEGSDVDTRRRTACDLVKTLSVQFESNIVEIFGSYITVLITQYTNNTVENWRAKDLVIYLVTSMASKGGTQRHGITQTSELVPLPEFCRQHIIPELANPNIDESPVLKADAIKFIITFRNVLGQELMVKSLSLIIKHLAAKSVVCNTYAACAIDKILLVQVDNKPLIPPAELSGSAAQLFQGLLNILERDDSKDNEYVMKAIMRSIFALQSMSLQYMQILVQKLVETLSRVAKNPCKPNFNYYLFESIAVCINVVCKENATAVSSFEQALFPTLQVILQRDILEFVPFVFQILSLLIENRQMGDVPEPYLAIFPYLLEPALWEIQENIPATIRLISLMIERSPKISGLNKLNQILGVFQKLIASKVYDHEGLKLLQILIVHYPRDDIYRHMRDIFSVLFQRLNSSKTVKFVKRLIVFFSFYAAKWGPTNLITLIDSIQNEMFGMVLSRLFIPEMNNISDDIDKKIITIGLSKILCETPEMMRLPYYTFWSVLTQNLIQMQELPANKNDERLVYMEDSCATSILNFAKAKPYDPYPDVLDPWKMFMQDLGNLTRPNPGSIRSILVQFPKEHQMALRKYSAKYSIPLF